MFIEKEVIESVLAGNTDDFRCVVEQYQGLVFSICLQMTGDRHEAENLAQDTFLKVYSSLSSYEFRGFKTWISRIAVNRCLDYKRGAGRYREEPVPPEEFPEFGAGEGSPVEELLIVKEEARAVREMCGALPDIYRSVITGYFLHSKSVRQIADEEDLNPKTVETRLYRGIKMLGRKLGQ